MQNAEVPNHCSSRTAGVVSHLHRQNIVEERIPEELIKVCRTLLPTSRAIGVFPAFEALALALGQPVSWVE